MSNIYIVKPGDTLSGIALKSLGNGNKWPDLHALNKDIKNPDLIYPGQKIILKPLEMPKEEVIIENPKIKAPVPEAVKVTLTEETPKETKKADDTLKTEEPPKPVEPRKIEEVRKPQSGVEHVGDGLKNIGRGMGIVARGVVEEAKGLGKVVVFAPLAGLEVTAKGAGVVVGATVKGAQVVGEGIAVGAKAVGKVAVATGEAVVEGVNIGIKTVATGVKAVADGTAYAGRQVLKGLKWFGNSITNNTIAHEFRNGYNAVAK